MAGTAWLEYSDQSPAQLVGLASEYRTDSIVLAFETALRAKLDRVGLQSLSQAEIYVLAIEGLEREVNNGGFDQFFRNATSVFAPIVENALEAAGLPITADIARDALAALELESNFSETDVRLAMQGDDEDRDDMLNDLDARFLRYEEDIATKLFEFISANRDQINF